MPATAQTPAEALAAYLESQPAVTHLCVAFSGGLDSHVLLHAVATVLADSPNIELRAVHVNHGLHSQSDHWCHHAEAVCTALNVPVHVRRVAVVDTGQGPEAAARQARYEAFAELLHDDEHMLLAQHADDQAETFLLQALRGAGPDGLASIPLKRTFTNGFLARPLLGCKKDTLKTYANVNGLSWIEDPSNTDSRFDRNFLRNEVMPLLQSRWPSATQTLSRAAMHSAAASKALFDIGLDDVDAVRVSGADQLSVTALNHLGRERAFNAIRVWIRRAGLQVPRQQDLLQVDSDLLQAGDGASGPVNARNYEFRRYRDRLYLIPGQLQCQPFSVQWQAPFDDLVIPETGHVLSARACSEQGIALPGSGSITVRSRSGGELIKLGEPAFHKAVKKVLQEAAVPPWQRESVPLLYVGDRLAAVWNVAVAVDFRAMSETV